MTGRATPLVVSKADTISLEKVRREMMMATLTLKALQRIQDFRKVPKEARDVIIAGLHAGRQVEQRLGFTENAEAYEKAIQMVEAIVEEEHGG